MRTLTSPLKWVVFRPSVGFVTQAGPPAASCRADEFEIWTTNVDNFFVDGVFFNIVVP